MPSGIKKTHKEFLEELKTNNSSSNIFKVESEYVLNTSPIYCKCLKCGKRWKTTPKQLLKNQHCPNCQNKPKKLTSDEYLIRFLKTKNSNKFIFVTPYESMSKLMTVKCKICGTTWKARPYDLLKKETDCPGCSGRIPTNFYFHLKASKKNPYYKSIKFLSDYKGAMKRIKCQCSICGHVWEPFASSILQGTGCPQCAKKHIALNNTKYLIEAKKHNPAIVQMTHEEFLAKFSKSPKASNIELLSLYSGAKNKIRCKCKRCGTEWLAFPTSLIRGTGCPECNHSSTSFMEQFLYFSFVNVFGENEVKNRVKDIIGKELDVFIPNISTAIEIGSWKWHKKIFDSDLKKREKCLEKGIDLFLIYDDCDNTSIDYDNRIIKFEFNLETERDYKSLKQLVKKICEIKKINCNITDIDWDKIVKIAYDSSQRISFDEFMDRFKKTNINSDKIEIISPFKNVSSKIKVRCLECGHIWELKAFDLLRRNTGCYYCRHKQAMKRRSKEEIIQDWRTCHPNGTKQECINDTHISAMTVYKWWTK